MLSLKKLPFLFCILIQFFAAQSQTIWFFRDAANVNYYDSGITTLTPPSTFEQAGPSNDKIPASSTIFFQGTNSLKLHWNSKTGGDWAAYIIDPSFKYQDINASDSIAFQVFAPTGLTKAEMPKIFLECGPGSNNLKNIILAITIMILHPILGQLFVYRSIFFLPMQVIMVLISRIQNPLYLVKTLRMVSITQFI